MRIAKRAEAGNDLLVQRHREEKNVTQATGMGRAAMRRLRPTRRASSLEVGAEALA